MTLAAESLPVHRTKENSRTGSNLSTEIGETKRSLRENLAEFVEDTYVNVGTRVLDIAAGAQKKVNGLLESAKEVGVGLVKTPARFALDAALLPVAATVVAGRKAKAGAETVASHVVEAKRTAIAKAPEVGQTILNGGKEMGKDLAKAGAVVAATTAFVGASPILIPTAAATVAAVAAGAGVGFAAYKAGKFGVEAGKAGYEFGARTVKSGFEWLGNQKEAAVAKFERARADVQEGWEHLKEEYNQEKRLGGKALEATKKQLSMALVEQGAKVNAFAKGLEGTGSRISDAIAAIKEGAPALFNVGVELPRDMGDAASAELRGKILGEVAKKIAESPLLGIKVENRNPKDEFLTTAAVVNELTAHSEKLKARLEDPELGPLIKLGASMEFRLTEWARKKGREALQHMYKATLSERDATSARWTAANILSTVAQKISAISELPQDIQEAIDKLEARQKRAASIAERASKRREDAVKQSRAFKLFKRIAEKVKGPKKAEKPVQQLEAQQEEVSPDKGKKKRQFFGRALGALGIKRG